MCNNRENNKIITRQWDDKFGMIDNLTQRAKEQTEAKEKEFCKCQQKVIEGVGKDAEVVTNSKGGKQSKSPMALHLVDPQFLYDWADDKIQELEYIDENDNTIWDEEDDYEHNLYCAIREIADYMYDKSTMPVGLRDFPLTRAMDYLEANSLEQMMRIARVLKVGANRYSANNWRLIPREEHINHALIHIIAELAGDTQDEHIDHALCRLMMAKATRESDDFSYTKYVDSNKY